MLGGEDEPNFSWCINMYTLQLESTSATDDQEAAGAAGGVAGNNGGGATPHMDSWLNVIVWKAGVDRKSAATYLGGQF